MPVSSDEDCEENSAYYRDRDEWKDVKSISQNDGQYSIVQIAYSDKFKDAYDYFRAVLKMNEMSERAFSLTTDCLKLNSANYTVWNFRRKLLSKLNKDLRKELKFISDMIEEHPKNYQVWHHRKCLIDWLKDPSKELEFVESILQQDAKNYHAWQHRQFVLKEFNLWEDELDYIDQLLQEDLRNNSAWNHRYFVLYNTTKFTDEIVRREVEYTKSFIKKAPNNESAWNYLRGVLQEKTMFNNSELMEFCHELYKNNNRSPHLLAFLIDSYAEAIDQQDCKEIDKAELLEKIAKLCDSLANEFDTIRQEYWTYMLRTLTAKYAENKL